MHARRYFVKALDAGDQRAALAIAAYRKLYKIEDELRALDPDARLIERQKRSKPVFGWECPRRPRTDGCGWRMRRSQLP